MMIVTPKKTYPTAVLAEIAGVAVNTFHQWRSRYGFLPKSRENWPRWTVAEICAARFVAVMVGHGLLTSDAVALAQNLVQFDADTLGYAEKLGTHCVAVYNCGDGYTYDSVPEGMSVELVLRHPYEIFTIINIREIIEQVRNRIEALSAENGSIY